MKTGGISNIERLTSNIQKGKGARTTTSAILLLGWLMVMPFLGLAAETAQRFDGANRLYEQGKYGEAITAYRAMIQSGEASAAVYFNLGNAYHKADRTGEAVASYRLAQRIAPRDPDVRANLAFVQDAAGVRSGPPVSWWQAWTRRLSLKEWKWLAAASVWVFGVLGISRTLREGWRETLKPFLRLALAGAVVACGGAVITWQSLHQQTLAVVKVKEAVVRYGPLDDSQSAFTLRDGAEVMIEDSKDGWWRVRDGQDRTGWVKAEAVVRLDEFVK